MTIGATMNPIIIGIIVKNDHQGLPAVFPQSTHIARGRMLLSSTVIPCSPQWGQRHIFIYCFQAERHGSADPTPCGGYAGPACSAFSSFSSGWRIFRSLFSIVERRLMSRVHKGSAFGDADLDSIMVSKAKYSSRHLRRPIGW